MCVLRVMGCMKYSFMLWRTRISVCREEGAIEEGLPHCAWLKPGEIGREVCAAGDGD